MPQEASGLFSAREFVWWYNGHPDYRGLPVDLSKVLRLLHYSIKLPNCLGKARLFYL